MEEREKYIELKIRVTQDQDNFLQLVAEENYSTKSALIRFLIEEYFEKYVDGIV